MFVFVVVVSVVVVIVLSLLLLYCPFSLLLFVVVGQRNIEAVYVVLLEFDLKSYSRIGLFDFDLSYNLMLEKD